jgi:hypothetical protein
MSPSCFCSVKSAPFWSWTSSASWSELSAKGDLMHRAEIGTERRRSWWLLLLAEDQALAADYIKAHARKVEDVMTRNVVTATPDTPLNEVARLLEKHGIKRVPIVRDGQLIGIVSRANLVQAVASSGSKLEMPLSDKTIRDKLLAHLGAQRWAHTGLLNATVNDGVVDLWGITSSETERRRSVSQTKRRPACAR